MADNIRRATMIARDQRALLRRIANIYPGPGGGMDPSPGGGGYSGPGGGKYIGPSRYADGGGVDDYGGEHRPPGPEDGAPLHDLTGQGRVYPDDIYGPNATRYYGHGDEPLDHGTMSIIRQFKGRPSAKAAIYRAVPSGLTTAEKLADLEKAMAANMRRGVVPEGESNVGSVWYNKSIIERARLRALPPEPETKTVINPGDWVTINRQYAKDHGESTLRGKYKIIRKMVRADELYTDGNSIHEYGYWPRTQRADGGSVPPFKLHSGAAKIIKSKGQAKATPQQYAAMPGIKPDELKHSKFDTLGSKALPREEVIKHLEDNRLPIEETQLGGEGRNTSTKFSDKTLPGGQNYREVLMHLPRNVPSHAEAEANARERFAAAGPWEALRPEHRGMYTERARRAMTTAADQFKSNHWDQPNVLAHVRMSDRVGPNGEKILHLEEAQSDWGQQGREEGFGNEEKFQSLLKRRDAEGDTPLREDLQRQIYELASHGSKGVPHGPYVDNTQKWTDLALKRVLHEAAHGGYDKIVVTPGDEQNKRYDLSRQVKNIQYYPDLGYLHATTHDDRGVEHDDVKPEDLSKHIGKEAADRILKQGMQRYEGRGKLGGEFYHELEGDGLKMGGAGMRGYYDNILPKRLQALAQQHDPQAKVQLGSTPVADDTAPLHSIDVTPQMRDSIKGNGFNSFKRGGEVEEPSREQVRAALARTVSPFSGDPEHVKEALRIASTFKVPTTTTSPGGYYNISQDRSPEEVSVKLAGLPGVKPKPVRKMSWEDLHKKGGSFVNLGGDRSTFGHLTRINGEPLAWPVDLHAGPNYMRELNPGLVWANAPGHATSLTNTIRRAADKGPVYGVYAPMGPRAVDSAHHMFDAVMAQIPGRDISKADAAAFDAEIKQGMHMPIKKRPSASKALEKWPGILNAKEASEFARTLPGEQRSGIIQHMDKKSWKDKGFPQIGVTRVAITDPDVFKASGNMLGHRVVQLDPDKMAEETKFKHGTYSAPTAGEYVGDVPLVQRHYAAPDVIEQRLMKPTVAGDIIHPYSASPVGRSSARKIFEEQKNIQPLNQRQLDSTMQGLERQKQYGLKTGGRIGKTEGGGIAQLQQNLRGAFSDLNRQVAAQAPQQQQAMSQQAPYGAYQRMDAQATGQAPNDAYQRMMAQALNGRSYEDMFPTTPKVAAPAPAVAPPPAVAEAMPYYQTNYDTPYYGTQGGSGGDSGGSGDGLKRGGRATNIVERALAVTRRK